MSKLFRGWASLGLVIVLAQAVPREAAAANRLFIDAQTVTVGQTGVTIPIKLDNDQPLYGLSLSITTDVALLEIKSVNVTGTVCATAQWADGQVLESGRRVTYGVVMSYEPFEVAKKIPAGAGLVVANLVVDVKATAAATALVKFEDVPAANPQVSAPAKNVLVGEQGLPVSFTSQQGTITIEPPGGDAQFIRGDSNRSGAVDISDAIFHLNYLFLGGEEPPCFDASDADDNGALEITDAISLLAFLFQGGDAPPPPYPAAGTDPTEDPLDCTP